MRIGWNQIRDNALKFSIAFKNIKSERAESQTFYNEFFEIFGVTRRRLASFAVPTKKPSGDAGEIDLLWKGKIICEHKSSGKSLIKARKQAFDYFPGINEKDLPRYVLSSDFQNFSLLDLDTGEENNFMLKDLPEKIHLFGFIAGFEKVTIKEEDPVNIEAAEKIALLHDEILKNGYKGKTLEILLSRILFCLFADDSGIFYPKDIFLSYLINHTKDDGSDLGMHLNEIFQVLDREVEERQKNLDEDLMIFPYVNGNIFTENIPHASFNKKLRNILIECCSFDWKKISPAIFGSLFQAAMDTDMRENLGAHYTSEKNVLKVLKPLFLDELYKDYSKASSSIIKLKNLKKKISKLRFLDPACGCGNFLVIAYRELRKIELEIIKQIDSINSDTNSDRTQMVLDIENSNLTIIPLYNFIGFEIDYFPSKITELSMWLVDHQMNIELSNYIGEYYAKIPIEDSVEVHNVNSNEINWKDCISERIDYIIGNPPFRGVKERTEEQSKEMKKIFFNERGAGNLDYVTCWFKKASEFIKNTDIKCAFVSTNSISQGIQPGVLWKILKKQETKIDFCYRTFTWDNDLKLKANVHVIIIGFSHNSLKTKKVIYDFDLEKNLFSKDVNHINEYLINAPYVLIEAKTKPLSKNVPEMNYGSIGYDNNIFIFNKEDELNNFLKENPLAEKYIKKYMGSVEMINSIKRWCLWLENIDQNDLKKMPGVKNKIEEVKKFRLKSNRKSTNKTAETPYLFGEIRKPTNDYIGIPKVSSIRRKFLPVQFIDKETIPNGSLAFINGQDKFIFGILSSSIYSVWLSCVGGKMKSDYQNSISIVYNNLIIPENQNQRIKNEIIESVDKLLSIRRSMEGKTLANLYDPNSMPKNLLEAHSDLDKKIYKFFDKKMNNKEEVLEYLMSLHRNQFSKNLS
jgi:hypothetical protein